MPGTAGSTLPAALSGGICAKSGGRPGVAKRQGPSRLAARGAVIQPPLFSSHQPPSASESTGQFVFTAMESGEPGMRTSTGSPSKTTRLAGRALWKIAGGSLFTAGSSGGASAALRRLSSTVSSGTVRDATAGSAARSRASRCAACPVSSEGKREPIRRRSVSATVRVAMSVVVRAVTSSVPGTGRLVPGRFTATAARAFSAACPGQEITCGW